MPRAMNLSVSSSRWSRISASNSSSARRRRSVPQKREKSVRSMALPLAVQRQHPTDHAGDTTPALSLAYELPAASPGNGIEPCFSVVIGDAPLRLDPPFLRETQQGSIYGSFIEAEQFLAELLE